MSEFKPWPITDYLRDFLFLDAPLKPESMEFVRLLLNRDYDINSAEWDFFEFFADCLHIQFKTVLPAPEEIPTRFGLPGLALAITGLREVLAASCQIIAAKIADDLEVTALFDNLEKFERAILHLPNADVFSLPPEKTGNPIIFFLVNNRRTYSSINLPGQSNLWKKFLCAGYRAMRLALVSSFVTQPHQPGEQPGEVVENLVIDSQIMKSTRAVFLAIKYVDHQKYRDIEHPIHILEADVSESIKRAANSGRENFEKSADSYALWAQLLLNGELCIRERRSDVVTAAADDTTTSDSENVKSITSPKRLLPEKKVVVVIPEDQLPTSPIPEINADNRTDDNVRAERKRIVVEQIAQGASKYEFERMLAPPPTRADQRTDRAGLGAEARRTQPLGHKSVWDGTILTQEILGFALASLLDNQKIADLSPERLAMFSFVLCQINFGFSPDLLIAARIDETHSQIPLSTITYLPSEGAFIIRPKGHDNDPVFAKSPENNADLFLPSAHHVKIFAPPILRTALTKLTSSVEPRAYLFDFTNSGEAPSLASFDELLMKTLRQRQLPPRFDERQITLSRIGGSAALQLTVYGELDPLLGAFVKGFVTRQYAAQAHYACVFVPFLRRLHRQSLEKTIARLLSKSCKVLDKFDLSLPDLSQISDELSSLAENENSIEYLGSPYVMLLIEAKEYLHQLWNLVTAEKNEYKRHNYLTLFTALLLMHLTSMRPIEIERLVERQILFTEEDEGIAAQIDVSGKGNLIFDEWRYLYLPAPFGALIKNYQQSAASVIRSLRRHQGVYGDNIDLERGDSFLFLCDQTGKIQPLTSSSLYQSLCKNDPLVPLLPVYPWETNSPRHLYATTGLNFSISRPIIDALMGHSSRGREPLNRNSFLTATEIRQAAEKITGKVAADLDFYYFLKKVR